MELTKDEASLLLYFESCLVDQSGKVKQCKMNSDDLLALASLKEKGLVSDFLALDEYFVEEQHTRYPDTHFVLLTDSGWAAASEERRARSKRMLSKINLREAEYMGIENIYHKIKEKPAEIS